MQIAPNSVVMSMKTIKRLAIQVPVFVSKVIGVTGIDILERLEVVLLIVVVMGRRTRSFLVEEWSVHVYGWTAAQELTICITHRHTTTLR
jgi:hypothetical protein